ncbi:fimbrial biogenesis outer membrane usher protein [Sphingomonas sp. So64.6b]|uniref:fimbria/pilus outer membrane usher protein n=1 Tax=Sphingomonas sp. So64.6b TaxID=2997354 RepID=UPI0016047147|nr:fimbria/pilus outer membrane usher protein [Sphingomonas sp. So64.6b]QNA82841.1 fimbrial biogenesis outer membrane usher protein [Sphingomonas sp. So64.6b]
MKLAALNFVMAALCPVAEPSTARAQSAAHDPPARQQHADGTELLFVAVSINGLAQDEDYLLARRDGVFLMRTVDLTRWNVRLPAAPTIMIDAESYVPLSALPGVTLRFDAARQQIGLTIPAKLFDAHSISGAAALVLPTESAFAAFLNYDLSVQYDGKAQTAAFLEAGISDDWGLLTSTMAIGQRAGSSGVTRLDSYFLRDDPGALTRLVIGDAVTDARDWSRQIRFGGVRFGTEFGLQPGLVTFPTPAFTGRTAIPSNVELLVNNARRFQTDVAQGPFSIDQVPLVNGAGQVTLVIRDALGVERRVTSSYYVSSRLLSRGLSAWSLEAGGERRDYGISNFAYRNPFAAGSYRRGITDWLSLEGRAELSGDVRMIGAGADIVWPAIGEVGIAAGASQGGDGSGAFYRVFFSRISPAWNVAISYQHASRDFDQLGIYRDAERITDQLQGSAGVSLGRWGNIGIVYTGLEYADRNRTRLTSASYSVAVGDRGYVSLFGLRSDIEGFGVDTTFGAGLTIPFGSRGSGYARADNRNVLAEVRRTPPTQGGWGYRLTAAAGESDRQQAELLWRGDPGEVSLEAGRVEGNAGVRALASGGLLFTGGRAYATRRVEDAVGVVDVPDLADVRIYQENRPVTRTDAKGRAIIPDLRAYEQNRIAIDPGDVPIDARMSNDTLLVVPRYRGAVRARFAIEKDHPATIVLQAADGTPIEAGTDVRLDTGETVFAGYGGEVFVREVRPGMVIEFETRQGPCRLILGALPAGDVLPRIGPLRCDLAAGAR